MFIILDPKPPQLQYSPQPHVSFDTIYPNNYYEVPSEYAVPKNFRDSEPGGKCRTMNEFHFNNFLSRHNFISSRGTFVVIKRKSSIQ